MRKENMRSRVAREAARILYYRLACEFKQAKEKAAKELGVKTLPSNLEVARELNRIADEVEGLARQKLIIRLREEALRIMKVLKVFHPRLIGSVWRGTARKGSDIDITVYSLNPQSVLTLLRENGYKILRKEWCSKVGESGAKSYYHIYVDLPLEEKVEVVVRSPEEAGKKEKCDIYGDVITGLTIRELETILRKEPLQTFLPKEK